MSMDPNAYYPPNAPPQGGGGSGKLWLGLGLGCGLALLLCCGGVGGFVWWVSSAVKQDPASVAQTSKEIAEVDVPPQFKPQRAFDLKVPITQQPIFRAAIYGESNEPGKQEAIMVLAEIPVPYEPGHEQEAQEQMEQQLRQQGHGTRQIQINTTREFETELRGQKIRFLVQNGKNGQSNKEFRQVVGVFPGRAQGTVVIVVQMPAEQLSDEQADDLIRSIK